MEDIMNGDLIGTNSVSFVLVFLEGIFSFLSPCVIPLIPVYMGYLAGSGKKVDEDGNIIYKRKKVFFHTMFFVLGISFSFFILGMSFTTLGSFFSSNKLLLTRAGGIVIILLGLFQLGIFDLSFLQKERKININLTDKKMNPVMALIMGFTFSFAWTPCIGPSLSSVLIMASGATTSVIGNILVFVYAIGFLLPFLLLGLFTTKVLNFIKSKQKFLKYTIKAGGAILIIMGVMIFTGWMNGISGYLNSISNSQQKILQEIEDKSNSVNNSNTTDFNNKMTSENQASEDSSTASEKTNVTPAYDFTLKDQYGNEHTLSDYKGKVVFLNFWATWCPPCNKELPDIEELYNEYNLNQDEVVFLGITNPSGKEYPNNQDVGKEEIISLLEDKGYTFPTLFDDTGEQIQNYNITAFPTTFMINKEGNIVDYVPGMMRKDIMVNVINQALRVTK
jgi:cytochrome c-type biogenesis protein